MTYRDVIESPIITEKSSDLSQNYNTITFSVNPKANKIQIKQAVEKIFNVKVKNVNTVTVRPKAKKVGKYAGTTKKIKKAIVRLAEGNTIELGK